jgi:hypothetical protein
MSIEQPARTVVQQPSIYTPPSADTVKPSAPVYTNYTYPPQQQYQTQWVNPSYQTQMYAPQQQYQQYQMYQYQQPQYVVAQPYQQQQQQQQGHGLAIAGGLVAGMLAANIIDDITDPY